MLQGKKILLCVTGGIAVYKAAALTSKLSQAGAEVKVMMSESAMKFMPPLTFQVLSRNEVYFDTFIESDPKVISHIELADWADLVIVAPATANIIAKLANGISDNIIVTSLLATTAPVWIAPAMNVHMYEHPAVQKNMETLRSYGYRLIEPEDGFLACGHIGKGRLEEPDAIVAYLKDYFTASGVDLTGKTIIITAGPTREKLDPVRFMTNLSTGKMGYALAKEAMKAGARVILISGPTNLSKPVGVELLQVESAREMYEAVLSRFNEADIVIKTAAVADYRPKKMSSTKLKKEVADFSLALERTDDILLTLGEKKANQLLVGFAAETDNMYENAQGKLRNKRVDMIVANDITRAGAGFGSDTNAVTIFKRDGRSVDLPMMSKRKVAQNILQEIALQLKDEK